jgi:hypothetical protein
MNLLSLRGCIVRIMYGFGVLVLVFHTYFQVRGPTDAPKRLLIYKLRDSAKRMF